MAGEKIAVVDMHEEWWAGRKSDEPGSEVRWFPGNYVEVVQKGGAMI